MTVNTTGIYTFATLSTLISSPAAGDTAYSTDRGLCTFDGVQWVPQTGNISFPPNQGGGGSAVTSVAGRTGAVVLASGDVSGLAASATIDTTNASNITSSTLPVARLPSTNMGTFYPAADTAAGINAAIAAATAAGGGIVQLKPITYTLNATIVPASGVTIKGAGYAGAFYATGGTILRGDGTFPGISYQSVDSTTGYANGAAFFAASLVGVTIQDLAIDTCTYGIKLGAMNQASIFFSRISNVHVSNCTQWGIWLDNACNSKFDFLTTSAFSAAFPGFSSSGMSAVGGFFFGGSVGSAHPAVDNTGNCTFTRIFNYSGSNLQQRNIVAQTRLSKFASVAATLTSGSNNITVPSGTYTPANFVYFDATVGTTGGQILAGVPYYIRASTATTIQVASTSAGTAITLNANGSANAQVGNKSVMNDINFYDCQSNGPSSLAQVTQAATMVTTSPNIGVTDSTKFPVDMPVFPTTTINGFVQYQCYFVVSSAANVITLSNFMGGFPITPTANSAINLSTIGFPPMEIVGYGGTVGNGIQPSKLDALDLEATCTTCLLVQNGTVTTQIGTFANTGQGSFFASSVCARSSSVNMTFGQSAVIDYDATSLNNSVFTGGIADSLVTVSNVQSGLGSGSGQFIGIGPDGTYGGGGISFGGYLGAGTLQGHSIVTSYGAGARSMIMPRMALMQMQQVIATVTLAMTGIHAGCVVCTAASAPTWTLPALVVAAAATAGATTGMSYEIVNATAFIMLVKGNGSQYFNNNSGVTQYTILPGCSLTVRAEWDGTATWWEAVGNTGAFPNLDITKSRQVPITGFAITVAAGITSLLLVPAGTLSTGTITTNAAPADNQPLLVMSSQTVTTLTVSPNTSQSIIGAPATTGPTLPFSLRYNVSDTTWYRAG